MMANQATENRLAYEKAATELEEMLGTSYEDMAWRYVDKYPERVMYALEHGEEITALALAVLYEMDNPQPELSTKDAE